MNMDKLIFFMLMVVAVLLRVPGIFQDFWFDEIWSYFLVHGLKSPFDIFTKLMNDNNHFLNSLLIYIIDKNDPSNWWKYRIFSLFCGIGTVIAGTLLSSKVFKHNIVKIITLLLLAVSFPLVVYSSEARGYSSLMFFSVLSVYALLEYLKDNGKPGKPMLVVLNLSIIFGFMSNLTFAYMFVGLLTISSVHLSKSNKATIVKEFAKMFIVPFAVVYAMCFEFLVNFVFMPMLVIQGGNPVASAIKIFSELPVYIIGFSKFGIVYSIPFWIVIVVELIILMKERQLFGLFCSSVIMVICCHLLLSPPKYTHFRYFTCMFPFLIVLFADFVCRLYNADKRYIFALLLTVVVVSNLYYDYRFIKYGRGKYLQAIRYIENKSTNQPITIGSDHDFRISMMIKFYGLFSSKQISYISDGNMKTVNPEWVIVHTLNKNDMVSQRLEVLKGVFYKLEGYYPYSGYFSGFNWALYKHP